MPRPTPPVEAYTDFEDYVEKHRHPALRSVIYTCRECGGCGWIYDPRDPPCPIEGNKMRDRIKCPFCHGSGATTREEMLQRYEQWRENYLGELAEYEMALARYEAALAKLTDEDRRVLGCEKISEKGVTVSV